MPKQVDHVNRQESVGADELLETLHTVMHRLRSHHHHHAAVEGEPVLTPLETRVLGFFARHPGATQRELADHSGRDKGQLARLLAGLRERGWLDAETDPADRRVTRLTLSEQARRAHQAVLRERRRVAESALAGFDGAERGQLLVLLQRLLANLEEVGAGTPADG